MNTRDSDFRAAQAPRQPRRINIGSSRPNKYEKVLQNVKETISPRRVPNRKFFPAKGDRDFVGLWNWSLTQREPLVTEKYRCSLPWLYSQEEVSMEITDEDLRAFPPPEKLIKTVREAVGVGDKSCQRNAQEILAERFYKQLRSLISHRYAVYNHIGSTYEMEDDLQRLYAYIIFGCREDSRGQLKQNKHPLLTWLENLESGQIARDLNKYVISVANSYLRQDLPRNIRRGRGNESFVTWADEREDAAAEIDAHAGKERQMQSHAHKMVEKQKSDDKEELALRRHVRHCLELLPSEDAELLHMKYCENCCDKFTQSEYARNRGMSEATVSRRIHKAKENLANLLRSACPDLLQKQGWSGPLESNKPRERR